MVLTTPFAAFSQSNPIIFERQDMVIIPRAEPETTPEGVPNTDRRQPLRFSVEIRPEDAMKLEYIHTLNILTDDTGVMIAFTVPTMVSLPTMQVYTPVDVLFANDQGVIVQMLPDVVPAEIYQDIMAKDPVKAFVYLKAGTIAAKHIKPHDRIENPVFTPPPAIIE
jgi:uncharacterized membrane protein (UPF0127 family)